MQAVALAAREVGDALLLVAAAEIERCDVGARLHRAGPERQDLGTLGDFLPHRLLAVERIAALVDVGQPDRLAHPQSAGVRLLLARAHPEARGLAGAVRRDPTDDPPPRDLE